MPSLISHAISGSRASGIHQASPRSGPCHVEQRHRDETRRRRARRTRRARRAARSAARARPSACARPSALVPRRSGATLPAGARTPKIASASCRGLIRSWPWASCGWWCMPTKYATVNSSKQTKEIQALFSRNDMAATPCMFSLTQSAGFSSCVSTILYSPAAVARCYPARPTGTQASRHHARPMQSTAEKPLLRAPDLFGYRKFWAHRLTPAPFLPMSRDEMDALGWDQCDVILVTGDAYVDHPSFGMAIVGRVLEAQGFRVGIICAARLAVDGRLRAARRTKPVLRHHGRQHGLDGEPLHGRQARAQRRRVHARRRGRSEAGSQRHRLRAARARSVRRSSRS